MVNDHGPRDSVLQDSPKSLQEWVTLHRKVELKFAALKGANRTGLPPSWSILESLTFKVENAKTFLRDQSCQVSIACAASSGLEFEDPAGIQLWVSHATASTENAVEFVVWQRLSRKGAVALLGHGLVLVTLMR